MPAGGIPDSILDDSLMRFLVCHLCKTLWAHNFVNAKPLQVELDSEDLKDFVRVFFKIEEAHWFYLDHYCDNNPVLPKVGLREFCEIVCRHVPYLQRFVEYLDDHWKAWKQYKANIPTAGAILLDETLEYVLVLESFSRRFGFPKGKKNSNETMQQCAVREVLEETGYDISDKITSDEYLELNYDDMFVQLFIVHSISRQTPFNPQTRGEVKSLEWMPVKDLPGATGPQSSANPKYKAQAYFMIRPFINPLRRWIEMNRKIILGGNTPEVCPQSPQSSLPPSAQPSTSRIALSAGKMLEVPLSVQKQAASHGEVVITRHNSTTTTPSSKPDSKNLFIENGFNGSSAFKFRNDFGPIEFEDFTPRAWTPGSIRFDGNRFVSDLQM